MELYRPMLACLLFVTAAGTAMAQSAADLYKGKCQGCHGAGGHPSSIGSKLGAKDFQEPDVAKMSKAELTKIITEGRNKMPAYRGKLTDEQIKALAKYIKEMKQQ